ncbi:hypothetical protein CTAYLR_009366 [Chrysophaeum taylorii]|uniref:Uncharacterized protein n=1 Tax=Chrysophaeum taylorii TaxID=2483200 RepID=A0AAD7XH79_9STRA|nr:hypothetical protein CTAYLR_009366 [Chrysophaeum taylorii]
MSPVSPFELVPSVLLSTLMGTFSIVDAGVAWRACGGADKELEMATLYFGVPIPIVQPIKMIVGPAILLLIPKIIVEDVLPLKRGVANKLPHIYGCLHFLPILSIFFLVPAVIGPAQIAHTRGLQVADVRQLRSANLALVFVCAVVVVLSALQVRAKRDAATRSGPKYSLMPTSENP